MESKGSGNRRPESSRRYAELRDGSSQPGPLLLVFMAFGVAVAPVALFRLNFGAQLRGFERVDTLPGRIELAGVGGIQI
jgi:hypothetical protein